MDAMKSNRSIMDGTQLFSKMRRPVIVNAEQTPQYSDVRNARDRYVRFGSKADMRLTGWGAF